MPQTLKAPNGSIASLFAFGTMQFGEGADDAASQAMFEACLDRGINHFDTAHVYTNGLSETRLGGLAAAQRDQLIIATKVGYTGGAGRDTIERQFEISRQRLNMDFVDVLYLHRFDADTSLEETFDTFADLKSRGLIRYIGLSNFAAWQVMKAVTVARDRDLRVDVLQPMYSLVKRQSEVEILPMTMDQEIDVAAYSPLGSGLLTGKYGQGGQGRLTENQRYKARYGADWMQDTAQALSSIAQELGVSSATLAVAWVAMHPSGPSPIISARTLNQLGPSLQAVDYEMSPELYARLSALSPTPAPATDRLEEA